ncbi:hypothetical protein [Streptomyces sp. NPDC004629]|uniref:hypothetical protein n=1 Tax=Streptomyces sp. NPDC004629 TaxID=3364705 RepID=UPI00368471DA
MNLPTLEKPSKLRGGVAVGLDVELDKAAYQDLLVRDVRSYLDSIGVPETGGDGWTDSDWTVGTQLNEDPTYNIRSVAYLTLPTVRRDGPC